ncbi:GIY-YIG nuclease family protein [Chloroflexota bacterium]
MKRGLPDAPGIYVLLLRDGIDLPQRCGVPIYTRFNGGRVLYVGIAQKSLQERDFKQHFEGTAGQSTLRKSIGVLFGYQLIPRDHTPGSRKTKFRKDIEGQLSQWMRQSLNLFFAQNCTLKAFEDAFSAKFNPPLNLARNTNPVNQEFRYCVRRLRSAAVVSR